MQSLYQEKQLMINPITHQHNQQTLELNFAYKSQFQYKNQIKYLKTCN